MGSGGRISAGSSMLPNLEKAQKAARLWQTLTSDQGLPLRSFRKRKKKPRGEKYLQRKGEKDVLLYWTSSLQLLSRWPLPHQLEHSSNCCKPRLQTLESGQREVWRTFLKDMCVLQKVRGCQRVHQTVYDQCLTCCTKTTML